MSARARPRPRLGLVLFLAISGLRANRIITALLVLAVAAGYGFQVPIDAVLSGYRAALLEEGTQHGEGAVHVRPREEATLGGVEAFASSVAKYPEVRAVQPFLALPGAVRYRGASNRTAVIGVVPDAGAHPYRLLAGAPLLRGDADGVLLGADIADEIGAKIGSEVEVQALLDTGPVPFPEESVRRWTKTVRGIAAGMFGARNAVFVDRDFLVKETAREDQATSVAVYLHDPNLAPRVRERIAAEHPELDARPWQNDSKLLASSLAAVEAITGVSVLMVILAVAIPVLALFYIHVLHRRRDVAVLSALGLGRGEIFVSFLVSALIVAAVGEIVGAVLARGLVAWFDRHPVFEWEGFVIRPALSMASIVRPALVVGGTTAIAGALPAWLAVRVDVARILRGNE
jgi:ABC-type lipoprotein release transport system permease subunit